TAFGRWRVQERRDVLNMRLSFLTTSRNTETIRELRLERWGWFVVRGDGEENAPLFRQASLLLHCGPIFAKFPVKENRIARWILTKFRVTNQSEDLSDYVLVQATHVNWAKQRAIKNRVESRSREQFLLTKSKKAVV